MTATAGAHSACGQTWDTLNWETLERHVNRLQMRIAKAVREGRYGKAKALQWLLTHSRAAKYVAVKRVVSNPGHQTPGVDGVRWKSKEQKIQAVYSLQRKGYKAQPLRRIYIPKINHIPAGSW